MKLNKTLLFLSALSLNSIAAEYPLILTSEDCNGDADQLNNNSFLFTSHTNDTCIGKSSSDFTSCKRNEFKLNIPFDNNKIRNEFNFSVEQNPHDDYNILWQMLPRVTKNGNHPIFAINLKKNSGTQKFELLLTTRKYKKDAVLKTDNEMLIKPLVKDFQFNQNYHIVAALYPNPEMSEKEEVENEKKEKVKKKIQYGYLRVDIDGEKKYSPEVMIHRESTAHKGHENLQYIGFGQYWKNTIENKANTPSFVWHFNNIIFATQDIDTHTIDYHRISQINPKKVKNCGIPTNI